MKNKRSKKTARSRKKTINILFTSIGNDSHLFDWFRQAYAVLGIKGRLIATDIDSFCPGLYLADRGYRVPRLDDLSFLPAIDDIIRKEEISLIIPDRDEDVLYFSEHKERFQKIGVRVMAPSLSSVMICNDKWKFFKFLRSRKMPTIRTWPKYHKTIPFPCIIKPRIGKGSYGFRIIKDKKELKQLYLDGYIIQEKIDGVEYTIDYFADFSGRPISVIPRIRSKVVGGESKVSITKNETDIITLAKKIGKALCLVGHNNIQCFRLKDGTLKILEVNPRFGGGSTLAIAAGVKSPEYLMRLTLGQTLKEQKGFIANLVMMRYSNDVFIPYDKIIDL